MRRVARWTAAVAAAAALLAFAVGQVADRRAAAAVPRVDAAHPPMAWGGPDGRRALDGAWVVAGDDADAGRALGWPRGGFAGRRVRIPFSPNAGVVLGAAGLRSHDGSIAWYRTRFAVAQDGDYALRFESVNHHATVWVDGRRAARHTGAYLPFDVPLRLRRGAHTVVVRADWRSPERMKATGWHRTWFNFGGIDREVTLRPLGASALEAPRIVTRLRGGRAVVDVAVRARNRGRPRVVRVQGTLGRQALTFAPVRLGHGRARAVAARAVIAHPDLWSPGHPALTELHLRVPGESGWSERVGLRELRWSGGRLDLNGRPLRLRGASLQEDAKGRGDALAGADMDALVARLRAIGANATRAQHPLSGPLVERLDAAGILLWQEVGPVDAPGSWTSTTPALRRRALQRDRTTVEQLGTHPSVLAWNLANEVADDGHPGGQAQYVDTAARMLHVMDPGRPVALDVWGTGVPRSARGALLYRDVDAIGVTLYEGWYQGVRRPLRTLGARLGRRLARAHRAFGDRVLVVSEFGAEANDLNAPATPGGVAYQARLLRRAIRAFDGDAQLDGWLVWLLEDYALVPTFGGGSVRLALPRVRLIAGINQKGLFTWEGRAKPAVAVVRRLAAGGP